MEPARYTLTLSPEPPDLLERLRAALAAQGAPAIVASRQDDSLSFESATGEFMLRARVADALTAVCEDWQARAV
jgi:hypothetical protein